MPEGAILEVLRGEKTQSEVAREWGVSRQAIFDRLKRYSVDEGDNPWEVKWSPAWKKLFKEGVKGDVSRQAVSERVWKIEGMPERVKRVSPAELPAERVGRVSARCPAEDTAIIDGGIDNEPDLSDFCLEL